METISSWAPIVLEYYSSFKYWSRGYLPSVIAEPSWARLPHSSSIALLLVFVRKDAGSSRYHIAGSPIELWGSMTEPRNSSIYLRSPVNCKSRHISIRSIHVPLAKEMPYQVTTVVLVSVSLEASMMFSLHCFSGLLCRSSFRYAPDPPSLEPTSNDAKGQFLDVLVDHRISDKVGVSCKTLSIPALRSGLVF